MSADLWNQLIAGMPGPHLLQSYEWGQVKARLGWQPIYLTWPAAGGTPLIAENLNFLTSPNWQPPVAAALVLRKPVLGRGALAARLCLLYCPKGPLLRWDQAELRSRVLDDLQAFARRQGAIFLKMDPDVILGRGVPGQEDDVPDPRGLALSTDLAARGWRVSADQVQFKNSVLLDVSLADEEMLARMKPKTRYNLRLSERKGVTVRIGDERDWPMLYDMYAETARRDGFVIRNQAYYQAVWRIFAARSAALIAELDAEPLAAVYLFHFAGRAYYLYGMSREAQRDKMPNYLLQWRAMRWARENGCDSYDLWGAPDEFSEADSMWGVFRFKQGLGGQVQRTLGAWDYAPNPWWYAFYTQLAPRLLGWMRARARRSNAA